MPRIRQQSGTDPDGMWLLRSGHGSRASEEDVVRWRAKALVAAVFSTPLLRRIGYHVSVLTHRPTSGSSSAMTP